MATLEERVAFLEGRVVEHSHMLDGIREAIVHLEQRMDRRFELVDTRFVALEQTFDRHLTALDGKLDRHVASLSQQFRWLAGLVLTAIVAIAAALVAR